MAWSPQGDLVATGSNDKTVKLMRYNEVQKQLEGKEIELTMHDGTVRDLCFLEDSTNKTSLLISGGAGDCKIYVTDCATSTPFQALSGHGGHILTLYNWGGAMFVSGSQVWNFTVSQNPSQINRFDSLIEMFGFYLYICLGQNGSILGSKNTWMCQYSNTSYGTRFTSRFTRHSCLR